MKFKPLKRLAEESSDKVIQWVRTELNACLRELFIGLYNLTFEDNFKSYSWTGDIAAGATTQIPHSFNKTPTGYIIYKQVGNGVIDASATSWTEEVVYLRNNGVVSVNLTAVFFV